MAAHIAAALEGGPRYDPFLSPEQRQSIENGIWLCQNCHKLIENDPERYHAPLLHHWKGHAEASARADIEDGLAQRIVQRFTGDTQAQRALRYRQAMLQMVKNTWVKGVLEQSLYGEAIIELGKEERADAIERPWDMVLQAPGLPPVTRMIDILDATGHSLLILGEPGSGKTTMLLQLAREAIARAEADRFQPVPVVFHLSSRAKRRQPLAEWLVEELTARCRIFRRIGQSWVEDRELLLLLDGLDEVQRAQRDDCVEAINDCGETQFQRGIVVCSRAAEYQALATKLKLQEAIFLQPLTPCRWMATWLL